MKANRGRWSLFVLQMLVLVAAMIAGTAATVTAAGLPVGNFPIATTTGHEMAVSAAFDGTNYLVGIVGDAANAGNITAQLVSAAGAPIGSRVSVGRTGGWPFVAFDGTNYLMAWNDAATSRVYGQFVAKSGALVNGPFAISAGTIAGNGMVGGVVFDGTNYLVLWCNGVTPFPDGKNWTYDVTGRLVSKSGTLASSEVVLGQAIGTANIPALAFDGTNYLAVWIQGNASGTGQGASGTDIYGRFVGKTGTAVGGAFSIDSDTTPSDNPLAVAFDGSRYLVVFSDASLSWDWSLHARFVTPAGVVDPAKIAVSNASGNQLFPRVSYNGTNYLIIWTNGMGSPTASTRGIFLNPAGGFTGSELTLFAPANDGRIPYMAGSGGCTAGKCLTLINWGTPAIDPEDIFAYTNADVYGAFPAAAGLSVGNFPIATTTGHEMSVSAVFDGTNYLVGIEGDAANGNNVTAQFVSATGAPVGSRISVGRTGGWPYIAFDGTNYLMIWNDAATSRVYGQFIAKSGALVNGPFAVSANPIVAGMVGGIVFDGTNYMVLWENGTLGPDQKNGTFAVTGRLVSPTGTMVSGEIVLGTATGTAYMPALAFDGTNYLAVWVQGSGWSDVYGRLISKSGTPVAGAFSIDSDTTPSDNPLAVAFDGSRYLVVFSDANTTSTPWDWNLYARFVTPAGVVDPAKITVSNAPGDQLFPKVSYNGTNYLITWTDGMASLTASTRGRFLNPSGSFTGSELTLFAPANDGRIPYMTGSGGCTAGKCLALINWATPAIDPEDIFAYTNADVYGAFIGSNGVLGSANISAAPNPVNFGSVQLGGGPAAQIVTFSNNGPGNLTVYSSSITGDQAQFGIQPGGANPCPQLPHIFSAGESCTLSATFTPAAVGAQAATLVTVSDAVNSPVLSLPLSGTGFGQFSLTTNITGSGSINSVTQPPSFSCAASSCAAPFDAGTTFTLRATPSSYFTFAGWNENGCTGTGDCTFALSANTTFNITFNPVPLVQIVGNPTVFQSLQGAYAVVADELRVRNVTFTENFNLDRSVGVILKCGLNSDFITVNGYTYLQGILTLRSGSLTVDNLVIR